MKKLSQFLVLVTCIQILSGCSNSEKLQPSEAKKIAKDAFIYGFPMVMNYKTLYANVINKNSGDYKGPFNEKSCESRLFTPEDRAIVTPNSDTPYCMFWCNLQTEPVVFTVPEVPSNRYYSFQLIDLYTHNFFYIGSLTTGSKSGNYLIASDHWKGEIPEGITQVVRCETDLFFTIIRTQLFDTADLAAVTKLQSAYQVRTLSAYLGNATTTTTTTKGHPNVFPEWAEGSQFTDDSFHYLDALLPFTRTHPSEQTLLKDFAKLGIGTSQGYDRSRFDEATQKAILEGIQEGFKEMEAFIEKQSSDPLGSTKIFGTRAFLSKSAKENYGHAHFYLIRAVGAYLGIYGNSATEATYPMYLTDAEGKSLDASANNYTLTFEPGKIPPIKAFWSLTMYDGKSQLLVTNPLKKYVISSTHADLFVRNPNGSLTLYIQHQSPGKNLEANWLPAPSGPFYCVMRLYGPKQEVLQGQWMPPKMTINN